MRKAKRERAAFAALVPVKLEPGVNHPVPIKIEPCEPQEDAMQGVTIKIEPDPTYDDKAIETTTNIAVKVEQGIKQEITGTGDNLPWSFRVNKWVERCFEFRHQER